MFRIFVWGAFVRSLCRSSRRFRLHRCRTSCPEPDVHRSGGGRAIHSGRD